MTQSDVMLGGSSLTRQKIVSSSEFDKLGEELLIETLIRLPLRPLKLCKCVSRRFRSLISGSYFIRCYVNYHQGEGDNSFALYYNLRIKMSGGPNPTFKDVRFPNWLIAFGFPIFESPQRSLSFLALSEQLKQHNLELLASNNGLVLCCEERVASQNCPTLYFVCNPLTKQWVSLPPPPSTVESVHVGFICKTQYLCDESDIGSKTSFKVVRLEAVNCAHGQLSSTLKLEVFCSVSGRWTEEFFMSSSTSDHELFYGSSFLTHHAIVCDNLLHWDALSNVGIFTYDPYNGECRTIKYPPVIRERSKPCLGECCGRLRYANFSLDDKNYRMWELKDYGNGCEWLLLHKIHLDEVKSTVQTIDKNCMHPLFPHPLNQDIVFFWCKTRIVEYNMRNKLLQLPCILEDAYTANAWFPRFFPFVLPCWPTEVPPIH